jgi:hypothetical protein
MTADAAHVAALEAVLLNTVCVCDNGTSDLAFLGCPGCDATVAVETLTPLIRAQVAAEIRAHTEWGDLWAGVSRDMREAYRDGRDEAIDRAARIAEGTP